LIEFRIYFGRSHEVVRTNLANAQLLVALYEIRSPTITGVGGPFSPWKECISPITLLASTYRERKSSPGLRGNATEQNNVSNRRRRAEIFIRKPPKQAKGASATPTIIPYDFIFSCKSVSRVRSRLCPCQSSNPQSRIQRESFSGNIPSFR
jgi:hypothetical protein